MKNCLIIYAERPVSEHAKEKLANEIGGEEAAGIYARIVFDLLHQMTETELENTQVEIWGLSPGDVPFYSEAFPEFRTRLQIGNDLGDRLAISFEKSFLAGIENVVIVNTEVPNINRRIITEAFKALSEVPVVIGPMSSNDIYLIGMQKPGVPVFQGNNGDDEQLLIKIQNNLTAFEVEYKSLDELKPLNDLNDLKDWRNSQACS